MGIDTLYADDIEKGLQFRLRNPQPEEPPASFSLSSFAGAGFKSLGVGGFQALANAADMAKAFQGADADGGANPFSTAAQDAEGAAGLAARQKALTQGNAALRQRAAEIAPDPITAHRADQVISGVGAGLTKAVAAISMLGPVAGSAAFGAGEADTTFREGVDRGLDSETAAKLAATTGVISGLTAGLPAGGSTVARTAALATAAGPASFIAQESISRRILQNAGHADEAAMHDPTDPWGLALSVALPGVMGAIHARGLPAKVVPGERIEPTLFSVVRDIESGGHQTGADGQILQGPMTSSGERAQGEMQVMPATAADPGYGIKPAARGPDGKFIPSELTRVGTEKLAMLQERYGGDTAKTMAAYNAGEGTVDKAVKAHGADWLAHMPDETKAYVAKGQSRLGDHAVTRAARDPETVDAARAQLASRALSENLPDHPEAAAEAAHAADAVASGPFEITGAVPEAQAVRVSAEGDFMSATIAGEDGATVGRVGGNVRDGTLRISHAELPPELQGQGRGVAMYQALIDHAHEQGLRVTSDSTVETPAVRVYESLGRRGYGVDRLPGGDLPPSADVPHGAVFGRNATEPAFEVRPRANQEPLPSVRPRRAAPPASPEMAGAAAKPASAAEIHAALTKPEPETAPGAAPAAKPAAEPASLEVQRAEAAITDNPDLRVQLPGSTETVSAAEALARVKVEAAHDATEIDLIRAAVQCALTFGN